MKLPVILSLLLCGILMLFNCKSNTNKGVYTSSTAYSIENTKTEDTAQNDNKIVICESKELFDIWQEILKDDDIKQSIANSGSSSDCSDYIAIEETIDLNNDGNDEIFVNGIGVLGSASTFPIWVIQKERNVSKIVLREQGEIYTIKKSKTNSYKDLFFPSRRNSSSTFLSTYKFQNGEYQKTKCQIEIYNSPKNKKTFECNDLIGVEKFESSGLKK